MVPVPGERELADLLRETRETLGWSQRHTARVLGVDQSDYCRWEQGRIGNRPARVLMGVFIRAVARNSVKSDTASLADVV